MCICGERLSDSLECQTCGKKFTKSENGLKIIDGLDIDHPPITHDQ